MCITICSPSHLRRDLAQLRGLLHRVPLAREEVLGEGVQHVHAVAEVAAADGDVHRDDLVLVGLVDLERGLQHVQEVGQLPVLDVLRPVGVELLPDLVEHIVVVISQPLLHSGQYMLKHYRKLRNNMDEL